MCQVDPFTSIVVIEILNPIRADLLKSLGVQQ